MEEPPLVQPGRDRIHVRAAQAFEVNLDGLREIGPNLRIEDVTGTEQVLAAGNAVCSNSCVGKQAARPRLDVIRRDVGKVQVVGRIDEIRVDRCYGAKS